jgi:hypothetical protein
MLRNKRDDSKSGGLLPSLRASMVRERNTAEGRDSAGHRWGMGSSRSTKMQEGSAGGLGSTPEHSAHTPDTPVTLPGATPSTTGERSVGRDAAKSESSVGMRT